MDVSGRSPESMPKVWAPCRVVLVLYSVTLTGPDEAYFPSGIPLWSIIAPSDAAPILWRVWPEFISLGTHCAHPTKVFPQDSIPFEPIPLEVIPQDVILFEAILLIATPLKIITYEYMPLEIILLEMFPLSIIQLKVEFAKKCLRWLWKPDGLGSESNKRLFRRPWALGSVLSGGGGRSRVVIVLVRGKLP